MLRYSVMKYVTDIESNLQVHIQLYVLKPLITVLFPSQLFLSGCYRVINKTVAPHYHTEHIHRVMLVFYMIIGFLEIIRVYNGLQRKNIKTWFIISYYEWHLN